MSADWDALQARLRVLFLDELHEHVLILNKGLVALEQGVSATRAVELVNELFRSAHSLKGAAQAAAVEPVAAICHGLESALADVRDQGPEAEIPALEPLFQAVDALATAGRRMREDGDISQLPVAGIVRTLSAAVGNGGGEQPLAGAAVPVRARPPAPRPEPVSGEVVAPPAPNATTQAAARVPAARLDALLSGAGEILLACEGMHAALAESSASETASAARALTSAQRALTDAVRQAGVVPFGEACAGLDRVVRDVARATGRQVRLVVMGGDVELDRPILDSLRDPLLHVVRNAVDHGIEPPQARASAGKDPTGSLTVAASVEGGRVAVTVSDDGGGVDADAVRAAAARRGMGAPVGPEADVLADLVFAPGVSTAPLLTEVSGRGVGLDAVRAAVEALGGSVALESATGAGTRVTMLVPVTRSVIRVLLVSAGGETFALPTSGVGRIVRAGPQDLRSAAGRTVVCVDGRLLPAAWLTDALGTGKRPERSTVLDGVVVDAAGGEAVLVVDGVVAEQEAVIKPPPARLAGLAGVLGATIVPGGRVVVVVNPATIVRLALERARPPVVEATEAPARSRRVLLVDDTLTTRTLERSILETAGYEVVAAVDGLHALELLQSQDDLGFDAVVTDVNMPRLDGLGLCAALRSSDRFARLPVVLVTSLASEDDRRRGVEAGADAYIAKSEFDQSMLLDTLARLL